MTPTRKISLARGAVLTAAGLGTAVLLAAAAPAMAKGGGDFGEKCGSTADTSWQPITAVSQKLESEGYTDFLRIVRKDGCYQVVARKDEARPMKLWLNPASLEVTGFSKIPPKRHGFKGERMGGQRMGDGHHGMKGEMKRGPGMQDGRPMPGSDAPAQPPQPQDN